MTRDSLHRVGTWVALALVVLPMAAVAARAGDLFLDHDEVEHLHASWLVSVGDRPFLDFVEHHNHTLWSVIAPLLPAGDDPQGAIVAGRALMLACTAGSLLLAWLLAAEWVPRRRAVLAPALLAASAYWTIYGMQVRPDVPMTTATLGAALLLVRGLRRRSHRQLAASGLAFALAASLLVKALVVAAMAGLWLAARVLWPDRRRALGDAAAFAAGLFAGLGLFVAWVASQGLLGAFWFWVVEFSRAYLIDNPTDAGFGAGQVVVASLTRDPLLWAGLLIGLGAAATSRRGDRPLLLVLALASAVAALAVTSRQPNYQYLVPALALFAVAGAVGLSDAADRARHVLPAALVVCAVVAARGMVWQAELPSNEVTVARMVAVLRAVPPDQTVLASPPSNPIQRRDAVRIWFNNRGIFAALTYLDPPPPYDLHRTDPARLHAAPPAAVITKDARYDESYRVRALLDAGYRPLADPVVWLRVGAYPPK